jgi:hypothetical protein
MSKSRKPARGRGQAGPRPAEGSPTPNRSLGEPDQTSATGPEPSFEWEPVLSGEQILDGDFRELSLLWHVATFLHNIYVRSHSAVMGTVPSHLGRKPVAKAGWDGSVDPGRAIRESVWSRIALACLRQRVDPIGHVKPRASDSFTRIIHPPPHALIKIPSDRIEILRNGVRVEVEREAQDAPHSIHNGADRLREFRPEWSKEEAYCAELSAPRYLTHSVFRCSLCVKVGLRQAAALYAPAGLIHYIARRDAYDQILGDFIARPLREAADVLYKLVDQG